MSQEARKLPYGDGRDALLAAVLDVVAEKGLRGATYRSVAARAGVNHALVTHHFGSMEGLLAATMEWSVQRSIEETGLSGIADFDGNFADTLIATVSAEPELQLFQFEMILESRRNPQIRAMVERLYANYVNTVEEALTRRGAGHTQRSLACHLRRPRRPHASIPHHQRPRPDQVRRHSGRSPDNRAGGGERNDAKASHEIRPDAGTHRRRRRRARFCTVNAAKTAL